MTLTASPSTAAEVAELLRVRRFVALTGAGMSTDSGIPDYRGPRSRQARPPETARPPEAARRAGSPMTYQEFVSGPRPQQRYWARSFLGWSRMHDAVPNPGHHALSRLEAGGRCSGVVTQNVDGLHEQAGTHRLVALHGRISEVVCLGCEDRMSRAVLQRELHDLNPGWLTRHGDAPARPDGDVALDDTGGFVVPSCTSCGGVLTPDVVFFGESVPKDRVSRCYAMVDAADVLLVLGSSLTVMSGFRFVRHAARHGKPVVIVNRGGTRGDELASYKLEQGTSEFLTGITDG